MKFLSLPTFDVVSSALNFDTPDCHVSGSCDLYTTKAAGSDKKLYKNIQQSLESQHAALLKLGASLSPPQRDSMAATLNLSRSSPFGSLDEVSNRRTFAYLIATLNASHPDYDFSHVLRPTDFKRERVLRHVMTHIDSTLRSVRPASMLPDVAGSPSGNGSGGYYGSYGAHDKSDFAFANKSMAPAWGPQMWAMIDKEMTLKDCTIFSYQPDDDPFDEDEGAIWALHYFFFNKTLKRVCYLYVRGTPVMSSHSPRAHHSLAKLSKSNGDMMGDDDGDDSESGATKRASYWLGDRFADQVTVSDDDMEDDGLIWNRDPDGDLNWQYGDDDDDSPDPFEQDEEFEDEDAEIIQKQAGSGCRSKEPVRGVSEDIASRMEIDI
ncbi:Maf1 regulator domain containing protein [Rhypophila decipiens]